MTACEVNRNELFQVPKLDLEDILSIILQKRPGFNKHRHLHYESLAL